MNFIRNLKEVVAFVSLCVSLAKTIFKVAEYVYSFIYPETEDEIPEESDLTYKYENIEIFSEEITIYRMKNGELKTTIVRDFFTRTELVKNLSADNDNISNNIFDNEDALKAIGGVGNCETNYDKNNCKCHMSGEICNNHQENVA